MGFFGAICGAIGSALGAIGGALSSVLSVLGSGGLGLVGSLISAVINALVGDKEDPEELGEKVLQAEERGIGKQNDESFSEARKRFDEFDIDPEKKHDRDQALIAGLTYQIQCGAEKGIDITNYALGLAKLCQMGLCSDNNKSVFENLQKTSSLNELNDLGKMFSGKLESNDTISQCIDKIAQAEKAANPNLNDNDAYREALKYRT